MVPVHYQHVYRLRQYGYFASLRCHPDYSEQTGIIISKSLEMLLGRWGISLAQNDLHMVALEYYNDHCGMPYEYSKVPHLACVGTPMSLPRHHVYSFS